MNMKRTTTVRIAATGTNHATNQSRIVELRVQATEKGQTMTTVRIADLIDKDVTGIRCDIRGGRHSEVMREGKRTVWSEKDWNVACETFERLYGKRESETETPRAKQGEGGEG